MKSAFFNPIARRDWGINILALASVLFACLSPTSDAAQSNTQKRVTSVRVGSANGGSRVTVVSDSALNDYEAYRRGDRFYVKIPAADFASGLPNLRGRGFEDVQVQKAADGSILSFRLQPGTAARVDQRSNRLDVVFSTLPRSENAGGAANATGREQNPSGNRADGARQVPPSSTGRSRYGRAQEIPATPSPASEAATTSVATHTPESLLAPVSPGQSTTIEQQPAPTAQGTISSESFPVRVDSLEQWLAQNWLLAAIPALLLVTLPFLFVAYRRFRQEHDDGPISLKQSLAQPKDPEMAKVNEPALGTPVDPGAPPIVAAETPDQTDSTVEPFPLVPPQSETRETQEPAETQPTISVLHSQEAKPLIAEQPLPNTAVPLERVSCEVKKLLAGEDYDAGVIDASDSGTRQMIAAHLLSALSEPGFEQYERARQAFLKHGYFDEVIRDLRTAKSAAERDAAASKLGKVGSFLATEHLTAALSDTAPEVRKSAVESLGQIGDPEAIPALNELLIRETSQQLPEVVIRHAIQSITVTAALRSSEPLAESPSEDAAPENAVPQESFVLPTSPETQATETGERTPGPLLAEPIEPTVVEGRLAAEEAQLRLQEEALIRAAEKLERRRLEAEAIREKAEEEAQLQLKAENEERARAEAEARRRAEEAARIAEEAARRAEEEAARHRAEEEARLKAERETLARSEAEANQRAEEDARFRMEAETLRRAAEELARRRAEAETARRLAEEETKRRAEEEMRQRLAEEERVRADEEAQLKVQEELRRRAEEEMRLRVEEEALRLADEENRRVEAQRLQLEAEERQRVAEERLKLEQEDLMQTAIELTRRRAKVEEARRKAEEESRLLAQAQEQIRMEDEKRRLLEKERLRLEAEAHQRRAQEERIRSAEFRRLADEEQKRIEELALRQAEEEERRLAELERVRQHAEEQARQRAEQEQRIRAEIEALRQAEVEQHDRIEAETRRRVEAETRLREEESRLRSEEDARVRAQQEALRLAEETRLRAEEARRQAEEEESRLEAERSSLRIAEEAHLRAAHQDQQAPWLDTQMDRQQGETVHPDEFIASRAFAEETVASSGQIHEPVIEVAGTQSEKEEPGKSEVDSGIPSDVFKRLNSAESRERGAALAELAALGVDHVFSLVSRAFDDESEDVRNAAARALYDMQPDRAASVTRALREGSPERRRRIGAALATSGLANDAISNLTGESRGKTYNAFSLLFLMAKAGEVQPLMRAIEEHANIEVRLAVVKLLGLSGQAEIVPAFRRLAVRGSLPSEVRSALMEAIYQISSQARESAA